MLTELHLWPASYVEPWRIFDLEGWVIMKFLTLEYYEVKLIPVIYRINWGLLQNFLQHIFIRKTNCNT